MDEKTTQVIKETIEELLGKAGFKITVEAESFSKDDQENIVCNIHTNEDSNFLIGQYGANLQAIQHLIRLIIRKKIEEPVKFILDVNSYRQEKNQSVIELAHEAADQALVDGRAVVLRPMSPYERRLIHMELSKNDSVLTESIGEGENRKVVVKPKTNII